MGGWKKSWESIPVAGRFLRHLPPEADGSSERVLGGSGSDISDAEAVLARYQEQRALGIEVHSLLLQAVEPELMFSAAGKLGLLRGRKKLVFQTESHMSVLQNYIYYSLRRDGETLIEQQARQSDLDWSYEEREFLEAGARCRFCLVLIEKLYPGLGFDFVDLLTGQQGFLVDINMSLTATIGLVMVTHVLPVHGTTCWNTSGAALPLTDEHAIRLIVEYVKQLGDRHPGLADLPPDEQMELETFVLSTCLKYSGQTSVSYVDAEAPLSWDNRLHQKDSLSTPLHIGRNDFCPCGSGKKFKRCCGSRSL